MIHIHPSRLCLAGWTCALLLAAASTAAADFATPGGPTPANLDAVMRELRADRPDLELLVSYGTSKGGSAGHLALAVRDDAGGDETVYSANFYADREPKHAEDFYTDDLIVRIPRSEYLYGTTSSVSAKASFGLDYGEIYKRSVLAIRAYGVPRAEVAALVRYFERINADYHARARRTEYHDGEVRYDYLRLNCAKTIGSAFRYGAGYDTLVVEGKSRLLRRPLVTARNANVPTEMAVKLLEEWGKRGYGLDVVLYRKYRGSPYVDPHEPENGTFGELPDRFPSVLSRDFRREADEYEDYDNLFATYLFYNLARYIVALDASTSLLRFETRKSPMPYAEAVARAARSAGADEAGYARHMPFAPNGVRVGATGPAAPR